MKTTGFTILLWIILAGTGTSPADDTCGHSYPEECSLDEVCMMYTDQPDEDHTGNCCHGEGDHQCDGPGGEPCPVHCHCTCHAHPGAIQHTHPAIPTSLVVPAFYTTYRNLYHFDFQDSPFEPPRSGKQC